MNLESKIFVTGANGMVGRLLVDHLQQRGYQNIFTPGSPELDLRDRRPVEGYFEENRPEYVFHLAAKAGGIKANIDYPGEFLYDNLAIQNNVIESARRFN